MINDLSDEVRNYLSAVGAVAIYVATIDDKPVRVGFTHDPRKTQSFLAQRRGRTLAITWLAWLEENTAPASKFAADVTDYLSSERLVKSMALVLTEIETLADRHKVTLTPHALVVSRAKVMVARLDTALAALQASSQLKAFNRAYRVYREGQRRHGESAKPYWAVRDDLRRVIIRYLVAHEGIDHDAMLEEIRQRFPWFHTQRPVLKSTSKTKGP